MTGSGGAGTHRPTAPAEVVGTASRRGFILPFVIISLAAALILSMAFASETLHAARGARGAVAGADAGATAEGALAVTLADWARDSLWNLQPGDRRARILAWDGASVHVEWQRLRPLVLTLRAVYEATGGRRYEAVRRDHLRLVSLEAPRIPVLAALTTNGPVVGIEGLELSGRDLITPDAPCGSGRDTASVPAVVAPVVAVAPSAVWPSRPVPQPPTASLLTDLQRSLAAVGVRAPEQRWDSIARHLPEQPGWRALGLRGPRVHVEGPTRWRGLLVVHGDLTVRGRVELTGLLVVTGLLDAAAAELRVQGAVVAADTSAGGVMLGSQNTVRYDRCAVQMALATVARPSLAPFAIWQVLPH